MVACALQNKKELTQKHYNVLRKLIQWSPVLYRAAQRDFLKSLMFSLRNPPQCEFAHLY